MATTKTPNDSQEFVDNPGQNAFDDLVDRESNPDGYDQRHSVAAGDSSDPTQGPTADELENIPTLSDEDAAAANEERAINRASAPTTPAPTKAGLYNKDAKAPRGFSSRLNGSNNLRKYLIVGGFGAALISVIFIIFSFLNVFKLDGLMSSIEQRAFLRTNATLDTRSSKLISAYVEMRLLDMGDNPHFDNPDFKKHDNLLFRATRVDHNNPYFDWYRTLRTSKFEQQVFEKNGIKFTSMVTADGKFRPGFININGEKPIVFGVNDAVGKDFDKLASGDISTINKYGDIVDSKAFKNNKEARRAIKGVVKENTRFFQVYKRRMLRKSIQNMIGVKDWRFFETTRDEAAQKRIDIRKKVLDKMIPDQLFMGRVARCLFGLDKCSPSRDIADPNNRAIDDKTIGAPEEKTADQQAAADKRDGHLGDKSIASGEMSDVLKKILAQANILTKLVNLPQTLDMLTYINDNIPNLVKLVVVARGAQAAGLFQVFETSRDQLKTGQVTSGEVNDLMSMVDTAGSSDGQAQVIDGNGIPGTTQTTGRCSQDAQALYDQDQAAYKKKYGVYAPLCSNQQIGSAANAQTIQDSYNAGPGLVIGPIAGIWKGANDTPIIGQFISAVRWLGDQISGLTSALANQALSILHLKGSVDALIHWVFGQVTQFLGVAILKGNELGGTIFNWLIQGAAYSAESDRRQQGAAKTNPATQAATQQVIANYEKNKQDETSLYDKVASLSNPDSLAYKEAYALSNAKSDPSAALMSGIGNIWKSAGNNFASLFTGHSKALAPDGYAASKFADIETYDYPQKCYDMDPITSSPLDGTNVVDVFHQNNIPISDTDLATLQSWDTETNSSLFNDTVYSIIRKVKQDGADDIAVQIYNCNLLDTAVRGSLGNLFGYTKDNTELAQ